LIQPQGNRLIPRLGPILLGAVVLLALGLFAWASLLLEGPGFPLDDAWIHQTYARSLAQGEGWRFAGQPSNGSTSPLWTLLLIPGHLVGLAPSLWAGVVGAALLLALGLLVKDELGRHLRTESWLAWLGAALVVLEWHLLWSALSGMETLAAGFLALGLSIVLWRRRQVGLLAGVLVGAGVWIRPDLLTLLGPAAWVALLSAGDRRQRTTAWLRFGLGMVALAGPYLLFQFRLAGQPWPSTFYAKQAEYAELLALPLANRWLGLWMPLLAGSLTALTPGVMVWAYRRLQERRWADLAPLLWVEGYALLFALRLPVSYQHGRYLLPLLPVLLTLGVLGWADLWQRWQAGRTAWITQRVWALTILATTLVFGWLGANAFATDVAIIETEMVRGARWIRANTGPSALVAAHDIGALGYYGQRSILDLAGLVSPEVIPILRDQEALSDLLDQRWADYLMTFPGWYPALTAGRVPAFQTEGRFSPAAGGENMAIFPW